MEKSRLVLEHYNLLRLVLEPAADGEPVPLGTYPDFGAAKFGSSIQLGNIQLPSGEPRFTVQLRLRAEPKEGGKFPYKLEIELLGVFDGERLSEEKRDALVAVNGASLLYGAAREIVLGLTSRSLMGAVLLPSVTFESFGEQVLAEKKRPGIATALPAEDGRETSATR